jgi:hypothetical protein
MPENVVERVVVPRNPPAASVLNKDKFNLFAPMARTNSPGLAAYNPDDFVINDQVVYINPVILQEIEENKEDFELLVNELNDLFARYDVTLEALNKAITDGLALMDALKLDKSTNASSVYATDENGAQTLLKYAVGILGYGLVQRTSGGDILVRDTPASISAAVNRKYVDNGLSKKLDALTNGDNNTTWLYGNDYKGNYGMFKTSPHGKAGHIVIYGAPDRTAGSEPDGTIGVHMPERPYQAVPREYVDINTPAHIAISMITEGEGEEKKEYVLRLSLINRKGDVIPESETSIDLPLEMAFVGAEAVEDENGNEFVEFTLQNGEKLRVGLSEIFNGKVDKTTEAWKIYGTGSGGNPRLYGISTIGKNGAVPRYIKQEETRMDSDTGYLNTPDPMYDFNCVNKRTFENGIAKKYTLPEKLASWCLIGVGDYDKETGVYTPHLYPRNPLGGGNAYVATFGLATTESIWTGTEGRDNPKYTLGGADPIYPVQYANKRYTDREDQKLWDFICGSFVETETLGTYSNPVYIPDDLHLLPFVSLDVISTGLKPKPDAYKDIVEDLAPESQLDVTFAKISTNKIKISTADYLNNNISVKAHLTESLSSGAKFKWRVSVVGGSYATQDGSTLNAADGMSLQTVNTWLVTNAGWEQNTILFAIGVSNGPVKYNDLELKFEVMAADFSAVDFVPIFAVEVAGETVYTIPQEIRDITHPVLGAPGSVNDNVYGLAINNDVYNYLDLNAKQYVIKCVHSIDEDNEWHVVELESQVVIDVSAYLTDDDGFIKVSSGGYIYFVDEDGNSVGDVSPGQVTLLKDKGAS